MAALDPRIIEQLCPIEITKRFEKVAVFHYENTVVSESMVEGVESIKPFSVPLFAAITPASSPLVITPWVPDLEEPLASEFDSFYDGICVIYKEIVEFVECDM